MFKKIEYKRYGEIPHLIMMCGLPGSGKSTFAQNSIFIKNMYSEEITKPTVHSSDEVRKELYGDENIQGDGNKVFNKLHQNIKTDLKNGKDVVYDATCISKKRRIHFLKELKSIPCIKVCVCMATTYEKCLYFNSKRKRKVPVDVIKKMYMNWQPPDYNEGFSKIDFVFCEKEYKNIVRKSKYRIGKFIRKTLSFDQKNKHHKLSLGKHSTKAANYIYNKFFPMNRFSREDIVLLCKCWLLFIATILHDNGKVFTKTSLNAKGEKDGNCHYYQHHCVGAYNSMFFVLNLFNSDSFSSSFFELSDFIVSVSNLIYYHMHPYNEWKQSEKALERDKKLLGNLYEGVLLLHEADVYAH